MPELNISETVAKRKMSLGGQGYKGMGKAKIYRHPMDAEGRIPVDVAFSVSPKSLYCMSGTTAADGESDFHSVSEFHDLGLL